MKIGILVLVSIASLSLLGIQNIGFYDNIGKQVVYQGECQIENLWIGSGDLIHARVTYDGDKEVEVVSPVLGKKLYYNTVAEPCECKVLRNGRVEIQ